MPFTIAIAGRPNVGKSTLFNRLVGRSMALVADQPGVTRDWREGEGQLFDLQFRLLDTAGLEDIRTKGSILARAADQTRKALEQTDVILLVVDAREGLTMEDKAIAREIRKSGKPVVLLANKCEGTYLPDNFDTLEALGFNAPVAFSAAHGEGLGDLYEALRPFVPENHIREAPPRREKKPKKESRDVTKPAATPESGEAEEEEEKSLHIAIVGRPNVGKSTLVNRLLGEERMLTGPEPGLTRDSIQIDWTFRGKPVRLVDTAGLRRRAKVIEKIEKMSGHESLRAIRLAHVVILVVDAAQPLDKQDLTIAQHVANEGRALVIAVNKWDTVEQKRAVEKMIATKLELSLAQLSGVPVVFISALHGEGLDKLLREAMRIYDVWNMRISTGKLNRWLEAMEEEHPPPIVANRRIKLRYMTQIKSRPPTFVLWLNKPVDLPDSYQRFLTNGLRKFFKLDGVPLRWQLRKGDNPYEGKKKPS